MAKQLTSADMPADIAERLPIVRRAANLIIDSEGIRTAAYLCPAGIWTIGAGHTGRDVVPGLIWTIPEVWRQLLVDLRGFSEGVAVLCDRKLTANQHGALVSFAFNLGMNSLKTSALLKYHKAKRYKQAAAEFHRWNKAKDASGKLGPLTGLTIRRAAESALYLEPDA